MEFDKIDWMERGARYQNEFQYHDGYRAQEQAILDVLAPLDFDTVLEVGCGFGRITKIVRDAFKPSAYLATDLSDGMLACAREYAPGVQFAEFDLDAPGQFADGAADLVICAEVLMHRPPSLLAFDISVLSRLAGKYLLTVDWCEETKREAVGSQWQHDYAAALRPHGSVQMTMVPRARQAIFLTTMTREEALSGQAG